MSTKNLLQACTCVLEPCVNLHEEKIQEMVVDALSEELKKENKSTTGMFVHSFDDFFRME